jgi:hypothetical protein
VILKALTKDCKIITAADYASGTADVKGPTAGIDVSGFTAIAFIVKWAAIAAGAVTSIKLQHSDTTTDGDFADVATSAQTVADDADNKIHVIEALQLTKKYYRLYIDKDAANAVAGSAIAILHGTQKFPVTQPSEVASELIVVPTSGTA